MEENKDSGVITTVGSEEDIEIGSVSSQLIAFLCIGGFGILSNGFAMVVFFRSKAMRTKHAHQFIISQTCIDFITAVFMVISFPTGPLDVPNEPGLAGDLFCKFWQSSLFIWYLFHLSSANLVCLTIERYLEVIHPIFHRRYFTNRRAAYMVAFISVFMLCYQMALTLNSTSNVNGYCWSHGVWASEALRKVAGLSEFLLFFILPVIIMVFCYFRMAQSLTSRAEVAYPENMSVADKARAEKMAKARRNIFKTMVVVAVCFVLCWVPSQINFLLFNFGCKCVSLSSQFFYAGVIASYLNTTINPVIYCLRYREFQEAVKKLFCGASSGKVSDESNTTSTTAA